MRYTFIVICLLIAAAFACQQAVQQADDKTLSLEVETHFAIEILNEEGERIIDPEATIKIEASGFTWTEGPLWVEEGQYLLFSDIPENKVYKLDANGDTTTYLYPSGVAPTDFSGAEPGSNGLILNEDGELILMQHGDRRVAKMNAPIAAPREEFTAIVDRFEGKRLNSPNDGAFDQNGNLYFTDPAYGLPKQMHDPSKELSFQGVYCLLAGGELVLLDSLTRPNGIAVTPDNKELIVAVSDSTHAVWYQYDLIEPGKVTNKRILKDLTELVGKKGQQGLPDGLEINSDGYIFATGAGGVWIFSPEGSPIARIYTGQLTSNCTLGYGGKKLFMTADDYILSVTLK
ncbi:SMP-30/gluconolactonase/LRE family protein [Marinoscillum furvescens]|uniref:Gluconolactonase n=1 Tax=Marinoscillum furvescens DSM 4134 TaxID=1122208 RepID=A0A3D9L526_MARFU|nr:SMP-30/gluconolactonase/LRE family protein [Marinoscillum furvescens]REE00192.1 gluconolactonase [Marinoscillum furvescens DSM 4134]